MEFSVPEAAGPDCIREIRDLMRSRHPEVAWPLEYRTLAADEIPLSPAYRRASVTISVHQAAELPYADFFADVEAVFRNHRGRPHWGKHHWHRAAELRALYPEWERFRALLRRVDPRERFLNHYLRRLLGE
jgi:FAD/FMN-containing dehydrogenase